MDDANQKPKEESSIDIVSLNNLVVNFRHITKKSKNQVIQGLINTIKKLRQKSDNPNDNRHKRAAKLLDEIKILKTSVIDDITKFCLIQSGNPQNATTNREGAAMMRMTKHKAIVEKIGALKKEHEDWESLVFFIKNHVPRRVKKKATKKRSKLAEKKSSELKTEPSLTSTTKEVADVEAKEEPLQIPMITDENLENLRNLGGVVQAFGAGDDCAAVKFDVVRLVFDDDQKVDHKKSKMGFFEGYDDDDDDKNENKDDDDGEEEDFVPKHKNFKNKQHHGEIRKPFTKNNFKNKSNHYNDKQTAPQTRERKQIPKKMENLHPSWEAKRKEKEMLKMAVPKSTKIIFDD